MIFLFNWKKSLSDLIDTYIRDVKASKADALWKYNTGIENSMRISTIKIEYQRKNMKKINGNKFWSEILRYIIN